MVYLGMGEGFGKDGFVSTMHAPLMVSCPPVGAGIGLVVAFLLLNKEIITLQLFYLLLIPTS